MKIPDSQASKSQSAVSTAISNTQKKKITSGEYSWTDRIFPLLDEMLKYGKCPAVVNILVTIYVFIQFVSISFWPAFLTDTLTDSIDDLIVIWIQRIALITDLWDNSNSLLITLIVMSILIAIVLFIFVLQISNYYRTRRFNRFALSATRIAINVIPYISLIPTGNWVGISIKKLIETNESIFYVHTAISVIYYFLFIVLFYMSSCCIANSPYISTSPSACWSGSFNFQYISLASFIIMISYIATFFASYYATIIIVLKILYNIYILYQAFYFPFMRLMMNDIVPSIYFAVTFVDVLQIVNQFTLVISNWILLSVLVVVGAITFGIMNDVNKKRIKKIIWNLSPESLSEEDVGENYPPNVSGTPFSLNDEAKKEHYYDLKLDTAKLKCQMYLRIGLSYRCPLFLDWSLIKFVAEYHRTSKAYCLITQLLAFFPCESRLLSSFFNNTCTQFDLSYQERFLMYQINVIKGLRQSSASSEIADKITTLKNKSNSIIETVRGYWLSETKYISEYYEIYKNTLNVSSLYTEALEKWPNNVRICENYSKFLIEAATDFKQGIYIKHKAELIEQGKNFSVDLSFRSLIRAFPEYLKKNVLDLHGRFIRNNAIGGSHSSMNNNSQMSTGTIDGILDPEIQETLGKQSFTYHRLRLEFQNNLEHRNLQYFASLHVSLIWNFLLFLIIAIFFVAFYYNHYDERISSQNRQYSVTLAKFQIDRAILTTEIIWLHSVGVIEDSMFDQINLAPRNPFEIDLSRGLESVADTTFQGLNYLDYFAASLITLANNGEQVKENFPQITNKIVPFKVCKEYKQPIEQPINCTLKEISINMVYAMLTYSLDNPNKIGKRTITCELFSNMEEEDKSYSEISNQILSRLYEMAQHDKFINHIIEILMATSYVLLTVIPNLIIIYLNIKELGEVDKLLNGLNQEIREAASKPIMRDEQDAQLSNSTMKRYKLSSGFMFLVGCLQIVCVIFMIFGPFICEEVNNNFNDYNYWVYLSISRSYYSYQSLIYTLLAVSYTKGQEQVGLTIDQAIANSNHCLQRLVDNNNYLLRGTDRINSAIGHTAVFDQLNMQSKCNKDQFKSDDHDSYRCNSLDGVLSYFVSLMKLANQDVKNVTLKNNSRLSDAFHIANSHLGPNSVLTGDDIMKVTSIKIEEFRRDIEIVSITGIVVSLLITIFQWFFLEKLAYSYKGQLQELRHVPPQMISSSVALMNYITRKKEEKRNEAMTPSKSVVFLSKDAVIFISKTANIEYVNESVKFLFGYQPDQLLGQPLNILIPQEDNNELYQTIEMMKEGQCSLNYERSMTALSDDTQVIPVHTTLVGIVDSLKRLNSFVIIMRDETDLLKQRESAQQAKEASEKLLYQILPRDIVTRINSGETNITMTVPMATVIFIDIAKFSQYSSTLSPDQIMSHLSIIFAKYDNFVKKYNLITKIKLIGDIYMAAAGLFSPDEPAQEQATQVINFALEALQAIEEFNNQMSANLSIRIGVNTNGPLIAGVLGTDKPVFDIIGDPINVAARLQSNGIPGTIQISETTFELVQGMNYNIEKRGEIELKGKGKKMVYVIRPSTFSSFFANSADQIPE